MCTWFSLLFFFASFKKSHRECKWHSNIFFIHKNFCAQADFASSEASVWSWEILQYFRHFKYSFRIFLCLDDLFFFFCWRLFWSEKGRDPRVNFAPSPSTRYRSLGRKWHVYESSIIKRTSRSSLTIHLITEQEDERSLNFPKMILSSSSDESYEFDNRLDWNENFGRETWLIPVRFHWAFRLIFWSTFSDGRLLDISSELNRKCEGGQSEEFWIILRVLGKAMDF